MATSRFLLPAFLVLVLAAGTRGEAQVQSAKTFEGKVTIDVRIDYLLFLPEGYASGEEKWPLLVFLHGAGERGDDLNLLKKHGPPKLVEKDPKFPFVVLSPQCPRGQWWESQKIAKLIDAVVAEHRIDEDRIYLTGLSMGGFGTWDLVARYPDRFAAIAPICAGGEPITARRFRHVPAWVFHGGKDPVVPIERSKQMVEALKRVGGDVKFTVYPETGHDAWVQAYDDPELWKWFLSKRRRPASPPSRRPRRR